VISNIQQTNCGAIHCDAFQDNGGGANVTMTDNWFSGDTDCWGLFDGLSNYTIENNLCSNPSPDTSYWAQWGGAVNLTFEHNTITSTAGAPYYNWQGASTTGTLTNNAWASGPAEDPGNPVGSPYTQDYNLGGGKDGAHDVSGSPTFAGGTSPSTWTGFQLSASSKGHAAGSDGQDMGIEASYFNIGTTQPSGTLPGING
jgi:hypothetical protein